MFTVKQLSRMAGITPRTLHYYDEIGLLKPSRVGENGYRYYGEEILSAFTADPALPRAGYAAGRHPADHEPPRL